MRAAALLLFVLPLTAAAQKAPDAATVASLKKDIGYLASDALEGRRTGSAGEAAARRYLIERYKKLGIPAYKGRYDAPFHFTAGRRQGDASRLTIGDTKYTVGPTVFALPWSGGRGAKAVRVEPLFTSAEDRDNPHFNWEKAAYERAQALSRQGAEGLVFWVPGTVKMPQIDPYSEYASLDLPVFLLQSDAAPASGPAALQAAIVPDSGTAHNVAAYLDNGAPYTLVVGAHYDHLGHGEDGSSLLANASQLQQIHNGADDNASGTAAVLELAARVKRDRLRRYNYLFVHFSGEELGLLGSKAFVKAFGLDSTNTAAMVNLDMVGRLVDSTKALTVGGVGTSPVWPSLLPGAPFKIVVDSSGIGPSDHTSFYTAGIPVLFFFTGTHRDYHKPSDDADKINYPGEVLVIDAIETVLRRLDAGPKPLFTATKASSVGKVRFKVTLGIMPDYSFNDGGVRVDGVTEGKPAAKAGVKAGDVLIQLGQHPIGGMQSYMEALGSFKAGDSTTLKLRRSGAELSVPVTF